MQGKCQYRLSCWHCLGNTPDESSKYPGDKAKNDNGKIFDGNVDARNHRAEVERMIS